MEQAVALIEKWGSKLAELAVALGPEVSDLAVKALAIQAISQLAFGGLLLGLAAIVLGVQWYLFTVAKRWYAAPRKSSDDAFMGPGAAALALFLLSGILLGEGASRVFDIWNWVWIYDPRLLIAKKVLGL